MALADVAATLKGGLPHRTCATCHALADMSDEDVATFRALLADKSVRFKALAAALEADDEVPSVPADALSRHARGDCAARERLRA